MADDLDDDHESAPSATAPPLFGSYIGLVYVIAILSILSFAVFYDVRPGHAFDRLRSGMTPTEVAAILGMPKTETKTGSQLTQAWREPDGYDIEVRFQDGRLVAKRRAATPPRAKS